MFFPLMVLLLTGGLASPSTAWAQTSSDSLTVIESYVQRALSSNHALQQERADLKRSFAALKEARGAFLPRLDLEARYSRATGGRSIDVPAGDLVNPVYETLNDLTGTQRFTPVENVSEPFLRETEQDTRLRMEQPLFVPRILYNYRANQHRVEARTAAVAALRRAITRDVKRAYFSYLQAHRAVEIFRATEALTEESLRTNERLFQKTRVTKDVVLRAKADVLDVRQQRVHAEKDRRLARSYLNVLLNRPLDTPVQRPDGFDDHPSPTGSHEALLRITLGPDAVTSWSRLQHAAARDLVALQRDALSQRPELQQVDRSIAAAAQGVRAAQARYIPEVVLAVDTGIQGTRYGFDGDKPFAMGSIVLRWNLFNGLRDAARVEQAQWTQRRLKARQDDIRLSVKREVEAAHQNVQALRATLSAAEERVPAAQESFRLTHRRHAEGMTNRVTLVDARTTLTDAQLNLSVTRYDYLKRLAELEYAVGLAGPTLRADAFRADAAPLGR